MEEEKNRKLSAKEQRRMNVFEATCERLLEEGYFTALKRLVPRLRV